MFTTFMSIFGFPIGIIVGILTFIHFSKIRFYSYAYVDVEAEFIDSVIDINTFKIDKKVWIRIVPGNLIREEDKWKFPGSFIRISKDIFLPDIDRHSRETETITYLQEVVEKHDLRVINKGAY